MLFAFIAVQKVFSIHLYFIGNHCFTGNGFQGVQKLHAHSPDGICADTEALSTLLNRDLLESVLDQLIPFRTDLLRVIREMTIVDHGPMIA